MHETISLKGVGMKACTGQRNLPERRLRHHELNTRAALQVLTLFPVWDELTIWNHSPGMGKSRFTAVSVRNRVYSCFIIYYYCIIYLYYNCKPTFSPLKWVNFIIYELCLNKTQKTKENYHHFQARWTTAHPQSLKPSSMWLLFSLLPQALPCDSSLAG